MLKAAKARGNRLRAEKLWIDKIRVLRSEVQRSRDEVMCGQNVVELAERIDRLRFRYIARK